MVTLRKTGPRDEEVPQRRGNGKGAVYAWEGNGKVGAGRMEITQSSPPSKVAIKLDFTKPFEAHNIAEFTLEPKGDSTNVTWAMYGPNLYVSKLMSIFFSMDNMIGKDFETGLANLKTIAEKINLSLAWRRTSPASRRSPCGPSSSPSASGRSATLWNSCLIANSASG